MVYLPFILIVALAYGQETLSAPPSDGHFFYADMAKGDLHFPADDSEQLQKHIGALVGNRNESLQMALNTMESSTWIYSS